MAYSHGTRTRMVIATALVLLFGCALIVWEFTRAPGGTAPDATRVVGARFDPSAVTDAIDRAAKRTFVPLAPPVVPKGLGNPAPFPIPEQRQH